MPRPKYLRINGSVIALFIALASTASVSAQSKDPMAPTITMQTIATSEIGLKHPEDNLVKEIVGDSIIPSDLTPYLPCSAIITNNSTLAITALTAVFRSITISGQSPVDHRVVLYNLDDSPERMILLPGESRILAPASSITYAFSSAGRGQRNVTLRASRDSADWCSKQKSVDITLDAAVFSNGELVGPDSGQFLEVMLNSQMLAIEDLANDVLRYGASDRSLHDWLMTVAEESQAAAANVKEPTFSGSYSADALRHSEAYLRVRNSYSQMFAHRLESEPEKHLKDSVVPGILSSPHIPTVHRRAIE